MFIQEFDKKGCWQGHAFERAIKYALGIKEYNRTSGSGKSDFRYKNKNYDSKQNGSPIKYGDHKNFVKGSNRIIYAPFISYRVIKETDEKIWVVVDLTATQMYVVDKMEFVNFILDNGLYKNNNSRVQVNVQSGYIYKSGKYHGRTSKRICEWCYEHELTDTDIIDRILEKSYEEMGL